MIALPAHFDDAMAEIFGSIETSLKPNTPSAIVEAICTQIQVMREARKLVNHDGMMVRDGKNNPIQHPALVIERDAQKHLQEMMKQWAAR